MTPGVEEGVSISQTMMVEVGRTDVGGGVAVALRAGVRVGKARTVAATMVSRAELESSALAPGAQDASNNETVRNKNRLEQIFMPTL
jgi:hypothetical protein